MDEFFDAVSDLMAQSFFSTASSIFLNTDEPEEGELLFPLHEQGNSFTEEEDEEENHKVRFTLI